MTYEETIRWVRDDYARDRDFYGTVKLLRSRTGLSCKSAVAMVREIRDCAPWYARFVRGSKLDPNTQR